MRSSIGGCEDNRLPLKKPTCTLAGEGSAKYRWETMGLDPPTIEPAPAILASARNNPSG